ncbi:hypothetical protein DFH07DRAFT_311694 [Mycena maculata]|uniref:Uncharacterized protein n=1 Tax=Mycena maculata TaxID=230809 RepID=A0AAD7NME9_9AGAR|nr:hypothetical protein DFH07DRAFT_311694 [Mycena maculata]
MHPSIQQQLSRGLPQQSVSDHSRSSNSAAERIRKQETLVAHPRSSPSFFGPVHVIRQGTALNRERNAKSEEKTNLRLWLGKRMDTSTTLDIPCVCTAAEMERGSGDARQSYAQGFFPEPPPTFALLSLPPCPVTAPIGTSSGDAYLVLTTSSMEHPRFQTPTSFIPRISWVTRRYIIVQDTPHPASTDYTAMASTQAQQSSQAIGGFVPRDDLSIAALSLFAFSAAVHWIHFSKFRCNRFMLTLTIGMTTMFIGFVIRLIYVN